ncbi:MAG: universal stress protein [Deltaproteobacteria bacterium]|nr:universal stress protein [Deltaproteobacteria bacterium]
MKVLVAYNGTGPAKNALNIAVRMSEAFTVEVHIINSVSISQSTSETFDFIENVPPNQLENLKKAEKILAEAKEVVEKAGLENETHLSNRQLSPGEDIVQLANDLAVDFVIVGVRHKSKVGKVLFGSTAQYVILNAPCPVVTTK